MVNLGQAKQHNGCRCQGSAVVRIVQTAAEVEAQPAGREHSAQDP